MTRQEKLNELHKAGLVTGTLYGNLVRRMESTYSIEKIDYLWEKHMASVDPADSSDKSLLGLINKIEDRTPSTPEEIANLKLESNADDAQDEQPNEALQELTGDGTGEALPPIEEGELNELTGKAVAEELPDAEEDKKKAASPEKDVKRPEPSAKK